MQNVSDNWKELHKRTMLNESFVEVSLDIGDPDARRLADAKHNGAIYISSAASELTNREDKTPMLYGTLEQNLWCLDGNTKAIPEGDFGDTGFVSDALSDEGCIFSTKQPIITINFPKVMDKAIPGVTIVWSNTYGEYPDTFTVRAFNGNDIVAEKDVLGNRSVKTLVFVEAFNYDKIEIIVKKWCLPNHRARVEEILIGFNRIYGKSDLFDYSHSQSVDLVSTSLPKNEIKFAISNVDGEYNPLNASGLAKYLIEKQEVKARYGLRKDDGSIEWIKGGTFYLSEWYAKQNGMTAEFTARDLLEFMSDIYEEDDDKYKAYIASLAVGDTISYSRNLYSLAEAVLKKAALPGHSEESPRWIIDESLKHIETTAPLPNDSLAVCLQLIANAARCVLYQDREGVLRIEPIAKIVTDYSINSSNSYSKPEITLSKPIYQVNTMLYTYKKGENGVESDSTRIGWIYDEKRIGETITIDNPLVTNGAMAMNEWLFYWLDHRMTLDTSWRPDVRLDVPDIVSVENEYGSNHVYMTEVEYKYNGAFRGTGKGKVIGNG